MVPTADAAMTFQIVVRLKSRARWRPAAAGETADEAGTAG
jgi:hypothetical protein